ncbi:MAG TPA: cytochrome c3 family protein [Tepidisphaeraceae bacterium]
MRQLLPRPFGGRCISQIIFSGVLCLGACAGSARAEEPATRPTTQAAKPTAKTERCVTEECHGGIVEHKVMHGPTAQKKCLACHQYDEPREHRFVLASKETQLCRDCHVLKDRGVTHAPVKEGHCTGCHDPHGSENRLMLVADPARGLCLTCHKTGFTDKKFVHGPVASGACIVCHEPHSSWEPKLLVESPQKLCKMCHDELVPKNDDDRHVHAPVKAGNCVACHDPHASDIRYQLRASAPDLCLKCHKDMAKVVAASAVKHGPVEQTDGCTSCHLPHFSKLPKLQRQTQPQLCLGCHDKPLKTADGKPLVNMAALLKENPQQHGPIREGECSACHQPHAGERFRLLAADYPPEFYAVFKIDQYALCFKCHMPDLVLKESGVGVTRFRQGDRNLHRLHVNQEKGRTCRACHEVHASKRPFHIRESVPFGERGWQLEINYEQTATGGSCSPGCHKPKTYDHGGAAKPGLRPTTQEVTHAADAQ